MRPAIFLLSFFSLAACTKIYYASMEKIGKEKRDILASRILDARKDQEKAKEQIKTTMEAFQELTGFQGGDLEKVYKRLNGEYEDSAGKAKKLSDRIDSIEKVSADMFREWGAEIDSMGDRDLKTRSRRMLSDTERRHAALMRRMHDVEKRMQPVLQTFHDKVLFLKHNLNARAISSLKQTSLELDKEVSALVLQIDASVQEADAFIATLKGPEAAS
jgi:hypothetical protein